MTISPPADEALEDTADTADTAVAHERSTPTFLKIGILAHSNDPAFVNLGRLSTMRGASLRLRRSRGAESL
ncbi:MAG: hypothetical protein SH850_14315 [Planctomycetaceae bacterium]|nr:hypothetical protein [Planctomycetaceae bacterium]